MLRQASFRIVKRRVFCTCRQSLFARRFCSASRSQAPFGAVLGPFRVRCGVRLGSFWGAFGPPRGVCGEQKNIVKTRFLHFFCLFSRREARSSCAVPSRSVLRALLGFFVAHLRPVLETSRLVWMLSWAHNCPETGFRTIEGPPPFLELSGNLLPDN